MKSPCLFRSSVSGWLWHIITFVVIASGTVLARAADVGPTIYSYDDANHLIQATNASGDGAQFRSDANGNTLSASTVSETALTLGTAQSVQISNSGSNAVLDFTVPANQQPLAIVLQSLATTPSNSAITLSVYNAAGALVASTGSGGGSVLYLPSTLAAGTYTVVVAPQNAATANMQVTVENAFNLAEASSGDGPIPLWAYAILAIAMLAILRRVDLRTDASGLSS